MIERRLRRVTAIHVPVVEKRLNNGKTGLIGLGAVVIFKIDVSENVRIMRGPSRVMFPQV